MRTSDFSVLFNKIKILSGGKTQKGLAEKLGISPQAVSDAKANQKIPETWWAILDEKFGVKMEDLIAQPVANQQYKTHQEQSENPTTSDMLIMTANVLESDTIYRSALASNIKAFYQAVQGEMEMSELKKELARLEKRMLEMSSELSEIKELIVQLAGEKIAEKKFASNNH